MRVTDGFIHSRQNMKFVIQFRGRRRCQRGLMIDDYHPFYILHSFALVTIMVHEAWLAYYSI